MLKTIVWCSITFLLGGIAAITYFTFFDDNTSQSQQNSGKSQVKYVSSVKDYNDLSMKQLDSLTSAANDRFTKRNAINHALSEL